VMLDSGLFQGRAIARLLDEHEAGHNDHAQALWSLLVFEGFLASEMAGVRREEAA
jgi:asparagine synthase (glutamine-hydrolysing)